MSATIEALWEAKQNHHALFPCNSSWATLVMEGASILMNAPRKRKAVRYAPGDYIKVEFPDEVTGIGEWMWVRVESCDDEHEVVIGNLDNEPVNDYQGKLRLGSSVAVRFSQVREHRKPSEFTVQ